MGKHAAPRTSPLRGRTAQRAAAVSAGTFVLCLGAAAPAIATTGIPTPPPLPQPIVDTVQKVSDITGVPNPVASDPKPKHHHHSSGGKDQTTKPQVPLVHHRSTGKTTEVKGVSATRAYTVPTMPVGGLRPMPATFTAPVAGRAPAMASTPSVTRIVQAAGQRALGAMPNMPPAQDTARILAIALAMTIVGGLTSGHLKAAQSRILA